MPRTPSHSRLLLVADRRADADLPGAVPVRRYRLARVRFDARPSGAEPRFEHLKRVYE